MAISYVKLPPTLSPVRNDVWMEVDCGAYRTGSTSIGLVFLDRIASPPAGHLIKMLLPSGESIRFEAVPGSPDDSGEQYTIGSVLQLANAMNTNPAFSALYIAKVVTGQPSLVIGGRWPSVALPVISFAGGAAYQLSNAQGNADYSYAANYSVRYTVWLERDWLSDRWEPLPTGERFPGPDLHARINVAPMLRTYVAYDWPFYGQAVPTRSLAPQRRYRVQVWERYGTPPSNRTAKTTTERVAWYAGQRNRDTPHQEDLTPLLQSGAQPSPWLTYRGRSGRHEVGAAQQHVLGWYRNIAPAAGTIQLQATVHYTDGSTASTIATTEASMVWGFREIALWPCGFDTLNLQALQPTKVPRKYTVQLMNQPNGGAASAVSAPHTFHLAAPDVTELHLEYVNSFGVVESLRCTGSWEEALDAKYTGIQRLREVAGGAAPPAATSNARQLLQSATNTLQLSTGFRDQGEHFAQMDLFLSPELRLVDHAHRRQLPVLLADGSHSLARRGADENEHIYALNLKLIVGDAETAWGDRALLPATPAGPTGGEPGGGPGEPETM